MRDPLRPRDTTLKTPTSRIARTSRGWIAASLVCALCCATTGCSLLVNFEECQTDTDCPDNGTCGEDNICRSAEKPRVPITGVIGKDTTWTADNVYVLDGIVTLTPSTTLTIEPGTLILGQRESALVGRMGAKIIAEGTREEPIVFTSAKPEGQRLAGDWGGVAVLGQARVNRDDFQLNILTDEADALFGGNDDTWNCGTFKYVRVEFAGGKVKGEEALNGLTLGGCGSQTKVEYLQIHFGEDDGLELFGGTVDLRHVLISRSQDDGLDIDTGWRGTAQFLAIIQDAAGDNAIEVDNLGEDPTKTPLTDFMIFNYTLIGSHMSGNQRGVTFKAGGIGALSHGIIQGHTLEAVDVFGKESGDLANQDRITIEHTAFFQIGPDDESYFPMTNAEGETNPDDPTDMLLGDDSGFEEDAYFRDPRTNNIFGQDPGIARPYDLLNPSFTPTNTAIVTGVDIPAPGPPFLATANYLGAFAPGVDPWTEDWTSFPEF